MVHYPTIMVCYFHQTADNMCKVTLIKSNIEFNVITTNRSRILRFTFPRCSHRFYWFYLKVKNLKVKPDDFVSKSCRSLPFQKSVCFIHDLLGYALSVEFHLECSEVAFKWNEDLETIWS